MQNKGKVYCKDCKYIASEVIATRVLSYSFQPKCTKRIILNKYTGEWFYFDINRNEKGECPHFEPKEI